MGQAAMALACEPLDARIRRFPRSYRRRVRKLVTGSRPLKDLLYSFPGAAFVLAAGNRSADARERAVQLVKAGEPLTAVAAALGVPFWLRRLPPEAFAAPFGHLPDEDDFGRRIVNQIPAAAALTPMWLQRVAFGAEAGDGAVALWLASNRILPGEARHGIPLLPVIAFAWFSRHQNAAAHRFIDRGWHRKMRFRAAVLETRFWLERAIAEYCLERPSETGGWHKMSSSGGYVFLPLRTAQELTEEGDRMRNCVASYAPRVAMGSCLIYSVRRGGTRVATLEIVPAGAPSWGARIAQLRGPENCDPADDVVRAARLWLSKRGRYPVVVGGDFRHLPIRQDRWKAIWQPFCDDKPQFRRYLLRPQTQGHALARIYADLKALDSWHEVA
jgi:hypothetical protein